MASTNTPADSFGPDDHPPRNVTVLNTGDRIRGQPEATEIDTYPETTT